MESNKERFYYPNSFKKKPMLGVWKIKDCMIWSIGIIIGLLIFTQTRGYLLVIPIIYAILTVQFDEITIKDYLEYLIRFFIIDQQIYCWERERTSFNSYQMEEGEHNEKK